MPISKILVYKLLFYSFTFLPLLSCSSKLQTSHKPVAKQDTLENSLIWITMIDSPGVNYYEAVAAFDKYWEHREKPTEDDGEGKDIYGNESKVTSEQEGTRNIQYVYEYKRFLNWQQRNKNLVKADGTIMTSDEVMEQWKKTKNDTLSR